MVVAIRRGQRGVPGESAHDGGSARLLQRSARAEQERFQNAAQMAIADAQREEGVDPVHATSCPANRGNRGNRRERGEEERGERVAGSARAYSGRNVETE